MRVVLFGSSKFTESTLYAIDKSEHQLISVVTSSNKPSGRGKKITPAYIKVKAKTLGYPVLQPNDLNDEMFLQNLRDCYPDIFVVVAFRKIPDSVLQIPKTFSINLHPSLLPKYRGATPIQRAIIEGDKITGISIIKLSSKIDSGNILFQKKIKINKNENAGNLSERLAIAGAENIVDVINKIEKDNFLKGYSQNENKATYASKFNSDYFKISWDLKAATIHNKIRALSPQPGAYCLLKNKRIKIFESNIIELKDLKLIKDKENIQLIKKLKPGNFIIYKNALYIGTVDKILAIIKLQKEGKKIMSTQEFISGYKETEGEFS